ncbi:hypothetical protein [Luteibacter sp.]|jgi:hypothetical protein|uniref:hypothetical protein n=1 Tax=Luteibacter sp. TaxID=1886636 RepID=UPI002F40C039
MASIFTGLAFMHGHIVDRDLVLRLGRDEQDRGAGARRTEAPAKRCPDPSPGRVPVPQACATC